MKLFALALCAVAATASVPDVNINTGSVGELRTLHGISKSFAKKIVAHREEHGPFASVDDLANVQKQDGVLDVAALKSPPADKPLPKVVPCPMSCEYKVVPARNHTVPILHLTHNSNNAAGAHGPYLRHANCLDTTRKCKTDTDVIGHTCKALTNETGVHSTTACGCFCSICTDMAGQAPCNKHTNECDNDHAGNELVYRADTKQCVRCGHKWGKLACAGNRCDAFYINDSGEQKNLTFVANTGTCHVCGDLDKRPCGTKCNGDLVLNNGGNKCKNPS
jgi:competence ComEA-like helix-hairpin-helix protein